MDHQCNLCNGEVKIIGFLGNRAHMQCRNCGAGFSQKLTDEEMVAVRIESGAAFEFEAGGTVEINHGLPYVAVTCSNGDEYFFQGEEAENLIDEVPEYVNEEDYIMYSSMNW